MALVLASKSPRRRELMALVAAAFEVDEAAVDEAVVRGLAPAALACELAVLKAREVAGRRAADVVIGCDTVVDVDGTALGKPKNPRQAEMMLEALSGRRHVVHTGVCIAVQGQPVEHFCESTAVVFAAIPFGAIRDYAAGSEPYDKAGGYGINGWAARWATRLEGCYYNVMGLPVARLYARLAALGFLPEGR